MVEERIHGPDDEVGFVGRKLLGPFTFDEDVYRVAARFDVDLEVHLDRNPECIESGPEVGHGCGNTYFDGCWHVRPFIVRLDRVADDLSEYLKDYTSSITAAGLAQHLT
jgi:hypothetical protein